MRGGFWIAALVLGLGTIAVRAADHRQFQDQIAPILEQRCVSCHSGGDPKGKLALTSREGLLRGGESGPVIEPGKPDESLLIELISGDTPEMPQKAKPLAPGQVTAIRKWVEK